MDFAGVPTGIDVRLVVGTGSRRPSIPGSRIGSGCQPGRRRRRQGSAQVLRAGAGGLRRDTGH
jgi:hypothetical protein